MTLVSNRTKHLEVLEIDCVNPLSSNILFASKTNTEAVHKTRHLARVEALRQFDSLSDDVEGVNPLNVENIILGLVLYFSPVNSLSNQKRTMCRGMINPRGFKCRRYAARLIYLNEYFDLFPGETTAEKNRVTELNEIFLNSIPNS